MSFSSPVIILLQTIFENVTQEIKKKQNIWG
jgi:hypothetical protein